jgi:hypothetical protein
VQVHGLHSVQRVLSMVLHLSRPVHIMSIKLPKKSKKKNSDSNEKFKGVTCPAT